MPETSVTLTDLIQGISDYIEVVHGGTLSLTAYDGETVTVRFGGNCTDCDYRRWTLVNGIERSVKRHFPDVQQVVAED